MTRVFRVLRNLLSLAASVARSSGLDDYAERIEAILADIHNLDKSQDSS